MKGFTAARSGPRHQRGATPLVTLLYILIFIGLATVALKLIPVYLEDQGVKSAVESLGHDPDLVKMNDRQIIGKLEMALRTNSIYEFDMNALEIVRENKGHVQVIVDYERKVELVGNLSAVAAFSHEAEVGTP